MKIFIGIICFLVMIVLVVTILAVDFKISVLSPRLEDYLRDPLGVYSILAAETNEVAATVTPKLISVAVSGSDGTVGYGTIALGKQTSTITLGDTQVAENDGTAIAKFNIASTNASGSGTDWSLQTSTGTIHQFVHKYSSDAGSSWIPFVNPLPTYYDFSYNVPVAYGTDSVSIDLFIAVPTSTDDYAEKSITVTIQAVSP